jgi:hypothetical protein
MLPEGAKDLDAWILSLDEEEREQKIGELLDGAIPVEKFEEKYLDTEQQPGLSQNGSYQQATKERIETSEVSSTDASATEAPAKKAPATDAAEEEVQLERSSNRQEIFGDSEPGGEHQDPGKVEDTGDGAGEGQTVQSTHQEGDPEPVSNRRQYGEESGTNSQTERQDNQEQGEKSEEGGDDAAEDGEPAPDEGEGLSRKDRTEDDTTELEPVTDEPVMDEPGYSPPPAAFEVSAKGEWSLAMLIYIAATVFLTTLITVSTAPYAGWLGLPSWWGIGPGAFIAIWVTAGFGKLRKRRKARSLRRHIEGQNV